uniref:DNA polymerase zeta catalytic subunit n=1 Tax=Oryza punctata TaxID=4537 RepID=A0A0E0LPJ2_ORYPU
MAASSSSPEPSPPGTASPVLSVRIVSLDYYMAPPFPGFDFSYSHFHGGEVEEVPVIRIYGSTPAGQKTCLHIHRVLPFLYVPCKEDLLHNVEKGNSYISGLLSDLEKALQIRSSSKKKHDGAVLNRVFQPYESHIPYLLHFLIDYNLYGMGYVHVTDFKFRPPLPDDFHPKSSLHSKVECSTESGHKVHPDNVATRKPTIWISSTVPHSLILASSATSHGMEGTNWNVTNRHSSLMLEADSRIEGILNEKYKMYTSLSQATADSKMVRSLLSIWEELEHLRLLEEAKPVDMSRPLRDSVLRSFLHGIKYENALSMLCPKEEVSYHRENRIKNVLCLEPSEQISVEGNTQCPVSSSAAQRTSSQLFEEHEKRVDAEALGLLSWLASSQAAEEPTTDDELVNEAILSPLFSKKSIAVALESAQLDFDGASQQECQDILDSIGPVNGEEQPNDEMSYRSSVRLGENNSLSNSIPQINGSSDENKEMTFAWKPPMKNEVLCFEGSSAASKLGFADIPPFFNQNAEENKQNESFQHMGSSEFSWDTLGVPTHFQNDGSALYLLTHAFSPPSTVAVGQWLTQQSCSISVSGTGHSNYGEKVSVDQEGGNNYTLPPYMGGPALMDDSPASKMALEHSITTFPDDTVMTEPDLPNQEIKNLADWHDFSQISGGDEKDKLTPLSQIGFCDPASTGGGQQLTIISIEVITESRGELRPDPRFDAINAVSLAVEDDADNTIEVHVLVRGNNDSSHRRRNLDGVAGCDVNVFPGERELLNHFINAICSIDPDIIVGWEIQLGSLGFLAERAAHLGIGLLKRISRTAPHQMKRPPMNPVDESSQELPRASSADDVIDDASENNWSHTHASGIHVDGRIILNLWRLMRAEVKLNNYSLEAVADEVLRRKVPLVPTKILSRWFATGPGRGRYRCIEYVNNRSSLNLEILNQLDLVNRTSELARVFGIDFFSVLSRGSQFRVESMLLRLVHTQNYLAISPGNQQVASQPAMECLPLVMEPESAFYSDPVVVLDFQSLYPSMIIAYNLCYSTCLGKVFPSKSSVLGVSSYSADPQKIADLKNQLLLTPNGVLYVQPEVRKGVLPRLLEEILSTRIMVKQAMKKLSASQKVLQRIFNARQLALKLIANVTYGYTAAGFSGRMPCAELADSIVQCGRRTLETAISFVNQHPLWKARVVYGDTDREEAFRIGKEIASSITAMNPDPVTLKFEKVYHPCFLLTKKRYVGYSYESPEQKEPIFDAKGIETVRRDTCPAVAKILEQSIRIMFEEQDLAKVRSYLERQWTRILSGKFSIQDFVFAKEVRLGTYSARASSLPPAAIVATKAILSDPRAEPRYGERVPYVVIHGEPGARLVDMVIDPYGLLEVGSPYRLNALYYITKQIIPALQRVFGLVGADLNKWFNEMPRPIRETLAKRQSASSHGSFSRLGLNKKGVSKGSRIDTYYMSSHCITCGEIIQGSDTFCNNCLRNEAVIGTLVAGRTSKLEREIHHLAAICGHCGGADWIVESGIKCISLACPVFFERRKIQRELKGVSESAIEAGSGTEAADRVEQWAEQSCTTGTTTLQEKRFKEVQFDSMTNTGDNNGA